MYAKIIVNCSKPSFTAFIANKVESSLAVNLIWNGRGSGSSELKNILTECLKKYPELWIYYAIKLSQFSWNMLR